MTDGNSKTVLMYVSTSTTRRAFIKKFTVKKTKSIAQSSKILEGIGPWAPPRKIAVKNPAPTNSFTRQAYLKYASLQPVYSICQPETSSVSAWGWSKGTS